MDRTQPQQEPKSVSLQRKWDRHSEAARDPAQDHGAGTPSGEAALLGSRAPLCTLLSGHRH